MSKAAEAFRTISEVADELDVQKHVLRFWEARFPQVRPMKRGGGRRYYRPEDMELLRGIRHLLHAEGYTIKGVQKILREQGIDHVKQYGRAPLEAAATPAPAAKRGRIDARSLPANVPATLGPQPAPSSAARLEVGTALARRGIARRTASPAEQLALVQAAIQELEECRSILLETIGKQQVRAPRRARAVGA
ncbi:MAG: MerR family transcriptional regulator [Hyphomicrobium sp.]|jgi:DNA-binding transcriptional MerR regulator